jgi:hypothetical protein
MAHALSRVAPIPMHATIHQPQDAQIIHVFSPVVMIARHVTMMLQPAVMMALACTYQLPAMTTIQTLSTTK